MIPTSNACISGNRALIQLAKAGAMDLGRRIRLEGIDVGAVVELRRDNIIKDVRAGHTVQFVHDIFFEWVFLHLLIDRDAAWLEEIRAVERAAPDWAGSSNSCRKRR